MLSQAVAAYWKQSTTATDSDAESLSLLYTVLPPLIQRRVPRIRSLRRTASDYGKQPEKHARSYSDTSDASETPPPSYHTSARTSMMVTEDEDAEAFHSLPPSRPSSSGNATPAHDEETQSGVQWKYARQGLSLLSISAQEESLITQDPGFSRKLYLDSLEYLLRGLPTDLTRDEATSLRAAFPAALRSTYPHGEELVVLPAEADRHDGMVPEPSVLHHCVASVTLYVFLTISFLIPYIQYLLQEAYRYDRKHKLSDRVFAQSVSAANTVGRQALLLSNDICAMNDGQLGILIKEMAS